MGPTALAAPTRWGLFVCSPSVLWLLLLSDCHFRSSFAQSLYLPSLLPFATHLSPFPPPCPPPSSTDKITGSGLSLLCGNLAQPFVSSFLFPSCSSNEAGNYITQLKEKNITGAQPCLESF